MYRQSALHRSFVGISYPSQLSKRLVIVMEDDRRARSLRLASIRSVPSHRYRSLHVVNQLATEDYKEREVRVATMTHFFVFTALAKLEPDLTSLFTSEATCTLAYEQRPYEYDRSNCLTLMRFDMLGDGPRLT